MSGIEKLKKAIEAEKIKKAKKAKEVEHNEEEQALIKEAKELGIDYDKFLKGEPAKELKEKSKDESKEEEETGTKEQESTLDITKITKDITDSVVTAVKNIHSGEGKEEGEEKEIITTIYG